MEEEEKSRKTTRKIARQYKLELDSETEEEIVESSSDIKVSDKDDSDQGESVEMTCNLMFPDSPRSVQKFLKTCWEAFSSPAPEKDLINAWYAAIFYGGRKKGSLYLGRVKKRFLKKKDGAVDSFELDCLKPSAVPSTTVIEEPPVYLGPDLGLFKASDVIAGPLKSVTYMEGRKCQFMEYLKLYNFFKMIEKIDHPTMYSKVYLT